VLKNKIKSKGHHFKNKDTYIMLLIFLITFCVRIPFLDYPVVQDSAIYADLSISIHENFSYELNGEPFKKYPPGNAVLASLMLYFIDDPGLSVRFVSILFSSLTICLVYLFLRLLDFEEVHSILLSAVVFLNPWFFYFTTILGLSEGAGTFFLLLGFFFVFLYFTKRLGTAGIALSSLSFGIAVMIRIVFIVVVGVFCLYFLWRFIHKSKMRDAFLFVFVSTLPFVIWFVRNIFIKAPEEGYGSYMSHSIISYPHALLYFTLLVFPLAFLGLTWHILKSFKAVFHTSGKYWKLILASFVLTVLVSILAWDLVNQVGMIQNPWTFSKFHIDLVLLLTNPLFATRYFVPFIPILTVLVGHLFLRQNNKRALKILVVYSCLTLLFTLFYNSGSLQNRVGEIAPIPSTFVQKADAILQLGNFLEMNGLTDKAAVVIFSDKVWSDSMRNALSRRGILFCDDSAEGCGESRDVLFLLDSPCSAAESAMNKKCDNPDCVFESRGRIRDSIVKCD